MHLIFSVDALAPSLSGIGRYTWELVSRLSLMSDLEAVRYIRQERWVENPADLLKPAYRLPWKSWLQRKEPKLVTNWRLKRQCRGQLFHGPNYFLPDYADIGIATIHDLSVFRFPETHPLERVNQFEANFTATLARAAHLITDTDAIRQEVISIFGWPEAQITAVPLGVATAYRPHRSDEAAALLAKYALVHGGYSLSVSTIEPRKKIDKLLDAYGRLPMRLRKRFPLVLIGHTGWKSERVHQQIERCCSEGWLTYLGFVPEADLPVLYASARLFVYPSQYEGFGLPVLEAMASGVPVITSCDPALLEVGGGTTLAVSPDDGDALLQAILKGLEDAGWRDEALESGLRRASQFTWERCVEQTVQVYRKLV